jgi:hypothetical protein
MEEPMSVQLRSGKPRADWLEHATRLHACPLCTAAAQYEADYLAALCTRLVDQREDDAASTVARGLCAAHITAFGHASRKAGMTADLVLAVHLCRLEHLANQLSELEDDSWPTAPECHLCLARNEVVVLCAHGLLARLADGDGETAQRITQAGGLCATHFTTCWEAGPDGEDRDGLRQVQLGAIRQLVDAARVCATGDEFDIARTEAIAARVTAITAT